MTNIAKKKKNALDNNFFFFLNYQIKVKLNYKCTHFTDLKTYFIFTYERIKPRTRR